MKRFNRREAGFSVLEVAVSVVMFVILATSFARAFAATDGLSNEARVSMKAHEEHRRNLDDIANRLRSVPLDTLAGFDATGTATTLTYKPVGSLLDVVTELLGGVLGGLLGGGGGSTAPTDEIKWRSVSKSVPGIANPGEVVLVTGGKTIPILKNVPYGGFRVTQQGSTLKVRLTTYYSTSKRKTRTVTSDVTVALRN
jgi:hypothetical protein